MSKDGCGEGHSQTEAHTQGARTRLRGTFNQAPITGESLPVDKGPGDQVFAGTINQVAEFDFRVSAAAGDSTLARIIRVVEEAQHSRAPTQRFVDAFARVYTPIVFAGAVLVALVPPLLFGAEFLPWIYKALMLLVIACPCALVISTPVTVVSGLAAAARRGILVKGGVFLERARKLRILALDKTGTLTEGRPAVVDFKALGGSEPEALRLAAALAGRSDHPVSGAVAAFYRQRGENPALAEVEGFEALAGRGVRGASRATSMCWATIVSCMSWASAHPRSRRCWSATKQEPALPLVSNAGEDAGRPAVLAGGHAEGRTADPVPGCQRASALPRGFFAASSCC